MRYLGSTSNGNLRGNERIDLPVSLDDNNKKIP